MEGLLGRFARHAGPAPGDVLLCGDAVRHAGALQSAGWTARTATAAMDFGVRAGECSAAILENALARDPWDRWLLQRVHRALKPGGILVVREPHQLDLTSPSGFAYVATRAFRQGLRAARRAVGAAATGPSFDGRRPSHATIAAMLAPLRFEPLEHWTERAGAWGALLPERFGTRVGAVARTRPSLAGLRDAWPEQQAHQRAYEAAQAVMLATRRDWVAKHPEWVSARPTRFDPTAYAGRSVLVLAPHPDDEVIGAGGTLLKLERAGARVVCVQATDGSAGAALERSPEPERREARLREARSVASACRFADLHLWRVDNGNFRATDALVDRMRALLETERPALVLAPFVTEAHEDHLTLAAILARALERSPLPDDALVLGYEVWSLVPASVLSDVTDVMKEVEELLFTYDIAMRIDDFVHFCADRALYHAWTYEGRPAYLEAFHAVRASDYRALLRTARPDLS